MPISPHFVLAHGFTQTARSWDTVRSLLASRMPDATYTAVDMPGHGDAGDVRGDLWAAADHLVDVGGSGVVIGYSMGGRVALHAAIARPDDVDRLVLIGATAGIESDRDRSARRAADEEIARRIERDGVPSFVDWWLQNPLFAGLDDASAQREDRCRNTVEGLTSSLRSCGTGTQEPLWDRLAGVDIPTLILVGEHDAKFRALGERLEASLPRAAMVTIDHAGHSVHLEQPAATTDAIVSWLGG